MCLTPKRDQTVLTREISGQPGLASMLLKSDHLRQPYAPASCLLDSFGLRHDIMI